MAEQAISKGAPPGSSSVSWHNAPPQQPLGSLVTPEAGGPTIVPSSALLDSGGYDESDNSYRASAPSPDPKSNVPPSPPALSARSIHPGGSVKPHEDDDGGWGAGGGFDD